MVNHVAADDAMPEQAGSRPNPDPTARTIDSLRREIGALRELIEARLDGGDKAVRLLQEATDRYPLHVKEAVVRLQELHAEKFESIQTQFKERDVRTDQSATATKIAVDAALQAAKEAVGAQNVSSAQAIAKSEAATTKQIDAIGVLITTMTKGIDDKIDDIKGRLTMVESRTIGAREQKAETRDDSRYLFMIFGAVIAIAGIAAGFLH